MDATRASRVMPKRCLTATMRRDTDHPDVFQHRPAWPDFSLMIVIQTLEML
jgi:hypothetical protein